ncbi:RNA methyltransferase, TrmH family [Cyclobacterium qasimii M12-11B]|uniref:RNA methyltransferase, TrmH family n=1 Tax=Cyclobacterium qasimii M12-11B TaxID=641524 RepID=S7V6W5_9BACT|nr:RNA methyltransferase, TrmH family [Cyclobacterium qasimii M12-11B]
MHQKKFRKQERAFFVEGAKNVTELLLSNFTVSHLLCTEKYQEENESLLSSFSGTKILLKPKELESLGTFSTNDQALAVAEIKENRSLELEKGQLILALDDIRDPGNLGTIIRIADWYGISKLLLSTNTADIYNPKVLNASMGSFTRMNFEYVDLVKKLEGSGLPIYGAFLEGMNVHELKGTAEGVLLMGNESNGISSELESIVTKKLTIPAFGKAESLNVAIATAVLCDNLRRIML